MRSESPQGARKVSGAALRACSPPVFWRDEEKPHAVSMRWAGERVYLSPPGAPTSLPPAHQAPGLSFPRADQALPLQPCLPEAALPATSGRAEAPKAKSKGKVT